MRTIVIIGGGFSGTITAAHLLRRLSGAGGRVVIINRSGPMARGVAYGTQSDHHVLNVPAGRMSAYPHDPDSFVRFVHRLGFTADGGAFVPRHLYGAYLEWLLTDAAAQAPDVAFERVAAEVLHVEPAPDGTCAEVVLRDGSRMCADRVVLAVGNYPPAEPRVPDASFFSGSTRYVADPWSPDAFAAVDRSAPTLLIGTGLTMVDVVLEMRMRGASGPFIALSRHGLLPMPHRSSTHPPDRDEQPPDLLDRPATMRAYVRSVRRHIEDARLRDIDWRDVVASLRPATARLWQALSLDERRRFLRHVRPFWEVHRHRVAPPAWEAFTDLQDAGRVIVIAGRLLRARDGCDGAVVRIRRRGAATLSELHVGTVVNCTGPAGDTHRLRDRLFEELRANGLLKPDALGLGIETSPTGALIGADGRASGTMYYVGPFLRARDWEATAVPELRQYAWQLAEQLVDSLARSRVSAGEISA